MGRVSVVVGVDGSGRTHRLRQLAAQTTGPALWLADSLQKRPLAEVLEESRAAGGLVVVDDAHRLDAATLRVLAAAARRGVPLLIARRPTLDRPELAGLDEAAAAQGLLESLGPLGLPELGELLTRVTGRPAAAGEVSALREASAGVAVVAALVAGTPPESPPPALAARVQRRCALLPDPAARLARVLALRLDLTDAALTDAAGIGPADLAPALRTLRDEGLLTMDGEAMIPAVAAALLAEAPPAERRRLHAAVARALLETRADPVAAARQLRAARTYTPESAQVYRNAGERLRFTDPRAAADWYDDAAESGADLATLFAGRAEAHALLGQAIGTDGMPGSGDSLRLALVEGAVAAHEGRTGRAVEALRHTGPVGLLLAVPALVAVGRAGEARAAMETLPGGSQLALRRLAEAALAAHDPTAALRLFIEAAEAAERTPPAVVLPDTPHALGAIVGTASGDTASAERLLERALAAGVGGPVARQRHRLLLAWVRMRAGRYDSALAELRRTDRGPIPGRERFLLSALAAGVARRSGDIARLRDAWSSAEHVLARQTLDLFQLEAVEELVVAAARLRQPQRITPILATAEEIVDGLGGPPAWTVAVGWTRLQVAVSVEDAEAANLAAERLAALAPSARRPSAQRTAAAVWARVLAGQVDADAVTAATEELATVELPWEASRLAGQAAIRTTDPVAARRLLERARELAGAEAAAEVARGELDAAGLSEREIEVARMVLAGRTHREIGAHLYISPKTVEHHVARIRTKLGVTSRAEFIAALREAFEV